MQMDLGQLTSWWLLFLMTCTRQAVIGANGPPYAMQCSTNNDCYTSGMLCYLDYKGCGVGVCACQYGARDGGRCASKKEGDACTSADQCPRGLDCQGNRCVCVGQMIDNSKYCLKSHEVLIGEACHNGETCLHKTEDGLGYSSSDVTCTYGYCQCREGLVLHGRTCRRVLPDHSGCLTNTDCSGDSVCKSGYCRCPDGNRIVTRDPPKCGKWNAITNLDEGQTCDEIIQKNKFCANTLQCVRCGQEPGFRCRTYRSARPDALSVSTRQLSSVTVIIMSLTFCLSTFTNIFRDS